MADEPERVLLYCLGADRMELAQRIRQLGYQTFVETDPRAAAARVAHPQEPVRAVLLPADFTLPQRAGELDQLARAAGTSGVRFVAVGERPDAEALRQLRDKNVRLCLWSPFHERELRFVLNRALFDPTRGFYDSEQPDVRHDLRVPTSLGARILVGEREKSAQVYSLAVGGCFLETQRPTLVGGALDVVLPLPLGEFRVTGRVVLTNVPGNLVRPNLPRGMGIEFLRLEQGAREAIQHYVRERARAYEL
jgi:hypothetical protein